MDLKVGSIVKFNDNITDYMDYEVVALPGSVGIVIAFEPYWGHGAVKIRLFSGEIIIVSERSLDILDLISVEEWKKVV